MKKVALVLTVLMFAVPAWAEVTIGVAQTPGVNEVSITYQMDIGDTNLPRAFALEITVDGTNTVISSPYDIHSEFYVYPGSIVISGGEVTDYGTPVADSSPNSMTIEMGSLYASNDPCHIDPPLAFGTLFKFTVASDDGSVEVCTAGNAARGNVVMEDPDITYNTPGYVTYECNDVILAACPCYGDITDGTGIGPPDGKVNLGDFTRMSMELMGVGTPYVITPPYTPPELLCGDITDPTAIGCPDGQIDLGDFTAMSMYLMGYAGSGYEAPCYTLPPGC